MNDEVISQIGLILTQLRYARLAMEQIERNTARYGGISFATALQEGARFGEPPLLNGALKVYVINIGELTPSAGIGGLIEGLLGGIGRAAASLIGGIPGAFLSTITLPVLLGQILAIANRIDAITQRIASMHPPSGSGSSDSGSSSGSSINLSELSEVLRGLTGLFTAASSAGPDAAGQQSSMPDSPMGQRWLVMLQSVNMVLGSINHLVDGLLRLIPIAVGAIAYLFHNLDTIKLKIIDLLNFMVRNTLIFRGVLLISIFDTIGGIAQFAARLVEISGRTLTGVMQPLFQLLLSVLDVGVSAIRLITSGIQGTVNSLMDWLENGLGNFLVRLGQTNVFSLLYHFVRMLPAIVGPLALIVQGKDLHPDDRDRLKALGAIPAPGSGGIPAATTGYRSGLDLSGVIPSAELTGLQNSITGAQSVFNAGGVQAFGAATNGLRDINRQMDLEAQRALNIFTGDNAQRLQTVQQDADRLAGVLQPAIDRAAAQPANSGLEQIARAYEAWLRSDGMRVMMGQLEAHFQATPTSGQASDLSIMGQIVRSQMQGQEPPPVTVEIDRLVIDLAPPTGESGSRSQRGGRTSLLNGLTDFDYEVLAEHIDDVRADRMRRGDVPPDPLLG